MCDGWVFKLVLFSEGGWSSDIKVTNNKRSFPVNESLQVFSPSLFTGRTALDVGVWESELVEAGALTLVQEQA